MRRGFGTVVTSNAAQPSHDVPRSEAFDDQLRRRIFIVYAIAVVYNTFYLGVIRPPELGAVHPFVLLPFAVALCALLWRFPWGRYHRNMFGIVFLVPLLLNAGVIALTGGWASVFNVYYMLVVTLSVGYFRKRIGYLFMIMTALVSLSPLLYSTDDGGFRGHLFIFVPTLVLAGVLIDVLSRQIEARGRQSVILLAARREAERETTRLKALQRAGVAVSANLHLDEAMQAVVRELANALHYPDVRLYLREGAWLVRHAYAARDIPPERVRDDEGTMGTVVRTGQSLLVTVGDTDADRTIHSLMVEARSEMCVPILQGAEVIGVLRVESARLLEQRDVELLELFSQQTSAAITNAQLHAAVAQAARQDSLTGLLNHDTLLGKLRDAIEQARRDDQPLALLFFDLDNFKRLNDTYGHPFGDDVLRTMATVLRDGLGESDFAGRYGGEEFVVVLPGTGEAARNFAETVRARVAAYPFVTSVERPVSVTTSGGYAVFPADGDDADALIETADSALYRAKIAGKNCVYGAIAAFASA